MSIASAMQTKQQQVAAAYTACNGKGATIPATQDLSNLPATISSIPANSGGGGILEELVEDIIDGNNPVSTTSLQAIETEIAGIIPYSTSISKTITASGTYYAVDDNANGYSSVTVDLSNSAGTRSVYDDLYIPFNCQIPSLAAAQSISGFNLINRGTNVLDDLYNPYAQSHITLGDRVSDVRPIFLGSGRISGRYYNNLFLLANATSTNGTSYDGAYSFASYNSSSGQFEYFNSGGVISNMSIKNENVEKIWNFGALKKIELNGDTRVSLGNEVEAILFPNLEEANLRRAFINFTNLEYISFPKLKRIPTSLALGGSAGGGGTFTGTKITELRFPSLNSNSFGSYTNQFNAMLARVNGCTVHFPSNLQSVIGDWTSVLSGFNGSNTTVLFDLPSTATT